MQIARCKTHNGVVSGSCWSSCASRLTLVCWRSSRQCCVGGKRGGVRMRRSGRLNVARRVGDDFAPGSFFPLLFAPLQMFKDGFQVMVEASGQLVFDSTNFIDDRIVHGFAPKNSSGVQIIGALNPFAAHTDSMSGRMVAFARCRQFHVNR